MLNFLQVPVGDTSASETLQFLNTGEAAVRDLSILVRGDFRRTGGTCATFLPRGAACSVEVAFAPTEPGQRSGSVEARGYRASPATVELFGDGQGAVFVMAGPNSFNFGSVAVGDSVTHDFIVTNEGAGRSGAVTVGVLTSNGAPTQSDVSAETDCSVLSPGQSCTITVTFAPSKFGWTGVLMVRANDGREMAFVDLAGFGTDGVKMTPSSQDFGSVAVGGASEPFTFHVTNYTDHNLSTPAGNILSDTAASSFQIDLAASTCPQDQPIAPGDSCSVVVSFVPQSAGPATGKLSVYTSDNDTLLADLSGTGASARGAPQPPRRTVPSGW